MKALTGSNGARSNDWLAVVQGVGKSFDECLTWQLRNITFGIRRGEVLGLVGPSAAGKTTLLKLLAGQLRPTEGKIKVFGGSPRRRAIRSRIGYLPQMSANSQAVSGGLPGWIGDLFRRTEIRENRVAEKSPGQIHWRNGLAQTVFGKRDLIILDEPFLDLDSSDRDGLKNLIETLAQKGKTVVFSSVSLTDVLSVCQRIAILNQGRMEFVGAVEELPDHSQSIRSLAPILPEPVVQKVRSIIREFLGSHVGSHAVCTESADKSFVNWKEDESHTATSTASLIAEVSESESSQANRSENLRTEASPVNHEKLSKLLPPKVNSTKVPSPPTPSENFDNDTKINEKLSALVARPK